jgi:hypothetical protein
MSYKKKAAYTVPVDSLTCVFMSNQDMTSLNTPAGISSYTGNATVVTLGEFVNANSPRIPRLEIRTTTGKKKSTFCNPLVVPQGAGTVKTPKRQYRGITLDSAGKNVITCFVLIMGIKRAWNMRRTQYDKISTDLTGLGIELATANDVKDLVWGCSAPYPAKAKKFDSTGEDNGNEYTTFIAPTKENNPPTGWSVIGSNLSVGQFMAGKGS